MILKLLTKFFIYHIYVKNEVSNIDEIKRTSSISKIT